MGIKYDPRIQKEINKFMVITVILTFIFIFIGLYIASEVLFLPGNQGFLFSSVFTMILFVPIIIYSYFKIKRFLPENEMNQLKIQLKKYEVKLHKYFVGIGIISSSTIIVMVILLLLNALFFLIMLPLFFILLGIISIMVGFTYKNNKEYYQIGLFKQYGSNVDKKIKYFYIIFLSCGVVLIINGILFFVVGFFLFI